jgi:adenylate cyclase
MFIDIRNFTKHVAHKTPAEIVEYQNAFFRIVINAVTKHNGIINQFLGDGCMVTFGAPVALANPAHNAVNAAMEIHQQLNNEIEKGNIPSTCIGIGIHVGDAGNREYRHHRKTTIFYNRKCGDTGSADRTT